MAAVEVRSRPARQQKNRFEISEDRSRPAWQGTYAFCQALFKTIYFEMLANRGIYKDGWFANTIPKRAPWQFSKAGGDSCNGYRWQLFNFKEDYNQSNDISAKYLEKLKEMQQLLLEETRRNQVLPLDDLTSVPHSATRGQFEQRRTHFECWGRSISVSEAVAPEFSARSFAITADITVAD